MHADIRDGAADHERVDAPDPQQVIEGRAVERVVAEFAQDEIVSRRREGHDTASTPDFLAFAAPKIIDLLPGLSHVPVLRSWGGVSSLTPDMQPILGETEIDGVFVAVSSYRGFMTSPAVGRMMSALVLEGDTNDPLLSQLSPRRFKTGDLIVEPLLNQE